MVRLLIPIINACVVTEAIGHATVLSRNTRDVTVELLEILPPPDQGRVVAFHSISDQREDELRAGEAAVLASRAMLSQANVLFTLTRVFGIPEQVIAEFVREHECNAVLIDTSSLNAFQTLSLVTRIWRLTTIPITLLHAAKGSASEN